LEKYKELDFFIKLSHTENETIYEGEKMVKNYMKQYIELSKDFFDKINQTPLLENCMI
jgi:hypothetical protein